MGNWYRPGKRLITAFTGPIFIVFLALLAGNASAQQTETPAGAPESAPAETVEAEPDFRPVRTDSPRQTLTSFVNIKNDLEADLAAFAADKTPELQASIVVVRLEQLASLIDLSETPRALRRDVGIDTVANLLDISGRTELPNLDDVPDAGSFRTR